MAEQYAGYELQRYMFKITGRVPGLQDRDKVYDGKMIHLGRAVPARRRAKLEGLPDDSYLIHARGSAIALAGKTDQGTLYAVYDFLREQGCRWVIPGDLGEIVPRRNALVAVRSKVESPDYDCRGIMVMAQDFFPGGGAERGWAYINPDDYFDWCLRNRLNGLWFAEQESYDFGAHRGHGWIQILGHTYGGVVAPHAKHFEDHPDWYALVRGKRTPVCDLGPKFVNQLCVSNPGLRDYTVDLVLDYFRNNPRAKAFALSPNPVLNPYPFWSMMPYWPELLGLTFLHVSYGTDEERLACHRAIHEQLGIDGLPVWGGPSGQHERYRIENEAGDCPSTWPTVEFPLYLHDLQSGTRSRVDDYPIDSPVTQRRYNTVEDVEAESPPPMADDLLSDGGLDMTRKVAQDLGETLFLFNCVDGAFSHCFRCLTFEGVYEALVENPALVHAIAERHTAGAIQFARASARTGVHAIRINEYPAGAEMLSDKHFTEFVLPYLRRMVDAFHDDGLLVILEYLGWVEPRLEHIAALQVDVLQTESSLKGYRNDVAEYRKVLGEGVCILGNSPILAVIEKGDEEAWRADAAQQSRGIGAEGRFGICAGSPTAWATSPQRLRAWGRFMQEHTCTIG